MLDRLKGAKGARRPHKRVGRGPGSGRGKTATRGMKGQGKRSAGRETPIWFEGGQMPLVRRVPKSGFKNIHRKPVAIVNVGSLAVFEEGSEIDVEALRGRGLVPRRPMPVKLLASGDAKSGLVVRVDRASAGARRKIEAAGGRVELVT